MRRSKSRVASGSYVASSSSPSDGTHGFLYGLTAASQHAAKARQVLSFGQGIAADLSEDGSCCQSGRQPERTEEQLLREARQCLSESQSQLISEDFLLKCLAQNHGRVAGTVAVAKGFLGFRHSAQWPLRIPADDISQALRTGMHWLLPARPLAHSMTPRWTSGGGDELGPAACLVYNAGKLDPSVCSIEEYQKMGTFLMEQATDGRACQERGVALVVDCGGVELTPMLKIMGLADIQRGVLMWRGAFPCRLRRLWVIDAPAGSQAISSGILRLLAPKVRERVRFACRSEQGQGLRDVVADLGSLFVLPSSLGGRVGEFDWSCEVDRLVHRASGAQQECADLDEDEDVASI